MSRDSAPTESDLDRFRRLVLQDSSLQEQLRNIDDHDAFTTLVVKLAAEGGYLITATEIDEAMRRTRQRWRAGADGS